MWDLGGMEGGMAPSEPATPANPPLPLPSFDPGQFLGNLGGGLLSAGSQALHLPQIQQGFGQTSQGIGQGFSDLGTQVSRLPTEFNTGMNAFSSGQVAPPSDPLLGGFFNYGMGVAKPASQGNFGEAALQGLFQSPFEGVSVAGGRKLNQGLDWVEQQTSPANLPQAVDPSIGLAESSIHDVGILGHGIGNLMQDAPSMDRNLVDAFREGFSP